MTTRPRHLRAVPEHRTSRDVQVHELSTDVGVPDIEPTEPSRTLNPADIVAAFERLGLDPDNVQSLVVTRPGLVIHTLHRIPDAIHIAERTTPDGTTLHTHRIPWTQEHQQ